MIKKLHTHTRPKMVLLSMYHKDIEAAFNSIMQEPDVREFEKKTLGIA